MSKVLILGASRGIGREFVRQYLADGWQVTATARRDVDVAALVAAGASAFALDLADAASAAGFGPRLDGAGFDVAIVNAGVYGPERDASTAPSQAEFDLVMHTNVLGAMRMLEQLARPGVLAPGARLAVLSSIMGSIGLRTSGSATLYRASKAALNSVLKDASFGLAGRAVCVALHPGWVQTDMGTAAATLTPERSVSDLRRTLGGLADADHGRFLDHDGKGLAW